MLPLLKHFGQALKAFVPYVAYLSSALSIIALWIVVVDRRPRVALQTKKGKWIAASRNIGGRGWLVEGLIEAYNRSSRANAITDYEFAVRDQAGEWTALQCEQYTLRTTTAGSPGPPTEKMMNQTPLALPPYSGIVVPIAAATDKTTRPAMLRITVTDLYGKRYSTEAPVQDGPLL